MHKLQSKSKTATPRAVIYFDTETFSEKTTDKDRVLERFKMGVAEFVEYDKFGNPKNKIKPKPFFSLDDFHEFIVRKARNTHLLYLIAHNLDFDFEIADILSLAKKQSWKIKFFAISQGVFSWKFEGDGYKVIFLDSGQFFKTSIKALGKMVGLEKLVMPKEDENNDKWIEYCTRDVDILRLSMEGLFKFIRDNDLGKFKLTIAAQSLEAFKHRFLSKEVVVHQKEWLTNDEILSYHGGRTEPFFIGKVPEPIIYDLDVNSLYPFVMKSHAYPTRYLTTVDNLKLSDIPQITKEFAIIADVEIQTPENYIPLKKDKLLFPVGHIRGFYTTQEILYAYENGYLKAIGKTHIYKKDHIFDEYVDFFFHVKDEAKRVGNEVYYKLAKLFLNSLYGKFGQRSYQYVSEPADMIYEPHIEQVVNSITKEISYRLYFNNTIWFKQDRKASYDTFVAIASHITANARMYLWYLMKKAGLENVYYVDTDSLFVNEIGLANLQDVIDNNKLGMLKVEKVLTNLTIYGAKDYVSSEVVHIKGIADSAVEIDTNVYRQIQFERFLTRLHNGIHAAVPVKYVQKRLSRVYEKAIIAEGGRCQPFVID